MSGLQAGTMLAYLAGATVLVCIVMAIYWSLQRVPPGFGLWTASAVIVAGACLLLADRVHFPTFARILVVPLAVVVAAVLRFQGIQRFLGQASLDRRWLLPPVIVVSLLAVFDYVWDMASARGMVIAAALAGTAWSAGLVLARRKNDPLRVQYMILAVVFAIYGAVWMGTGIHWLVSGVGFPTDNIDLQGVILLAVVTSFEFLWLVMSLLLSGRWSTKALESDREALDTERRQLAMIISSLPDATFALDREGNVVAWNRSAEMITGVLAKDVLGLPRSKGGARDLAKGGVTLSEVLLDPKKEVPTGYLNLARDGDSLSAEQEWSAPDGHVGPEHVWHTATLLRDAEGDIVGTIESVRDITWRVKTEETLRESEEKYRALFEHNLDGVLVIAPGGTVIDANSAACEMLGMTREEICAAEPGGLVHSAGDAERLFGSQSDPGAALRHVSFVRGDGSSFEAECMYVVWDDALNRLRAFVQFRDISERLVAQRLLRESQERLLGAGATLDIGNWEMDLAAGHIWMSPEAMRLFGIEQDSPYFPLEVDTLTDLAEDPEVLRDAVERVMREGGSYDIEYRIKRANDGETRKMHSIGSAVRDENGEPVRVVGATQDVSAWDGAGEAADASVSSLGGRLDDQVYWVDPTGRVTNVSESACAKLGYTREELLGMTIYDIDPSLRPELMSPWEAVKDLGSRWYDTVHRTKAGRDIPVRVVVNYISHGEEEYRFVVARDVSVRKHLEKTLEKARLSLQYGRDMIFWVDPEGRLTFVGESACNKLGYEPSELLGRTLAELDPGTSLEWRLVWASLGEQGSVERKAVLRAKDGHEIPVEVSFALVAHGGREYALAVAREEAMVSEGGRMMPVGGLDALQDQKLEAVGQLAGGIAHDFNNLLTAIIGYDSLILTGEDAKQSSPLRRDAEEIRNAAERAAALTSQILAFARRQPLRPQEVRLGELVAGMESRIRSLLKDDIELVLPESGEGGVVQVDVAQYEQVLENLVRNAREAMPDGGRLVIDIEDAELSEEYCRAYPELGAGSYVMMSVTDSGVGMDADTRLRIFEPFFTTKPPGEGAGLGLSAAYGFIKQSGGHVVAYSEADKGTTLKVYLPKVTTPHHAVPVSTDPTASPPRGSETIVVVEDEPPLRRLVARVLGELGYKILVAGNGSEALQLLEDMEMPPDMLMTDVVLPGGIQGNELAKKALARVPGLPVLYMSGHPRDAIVHSGRLDEGVCFLAKPFTPQTLAAKVREVLDEAPSLG